MIHLVEKDHISYRGKLPSDGTEQKEDMLSGSKSMAVMNKKEANK